MATVGDSSPVTPKGKETKMRIFHAAVKEFSESGYAGARVDRIARRAGVAKERIYAYFGDKQGLFVEVWRYTSDFITEEDQNLMALTENDLPDLGRILLRRYLNFHETHPEFWRIFVLENLMGTRHSRRGNTNRNYEHVRDLYRKGQSLQVFDPHVSFESFLFVLIAVTFFYASNWKTMSDTLGADLSSPGVKDRMFEEIATLLLDHRR
jgi:AcrR family transcriptional regulator